MSQSPITIALFALRNRNNVPMSEYVLCEDCLTPRNTEILYVDASTYNITNEIPADDPGYIMCSGEDPIRMIDASTANRYQCHICQCDGTEAPERDYRIWFTMPLGVRMTLDEIIEYAKHLSPIGISLVEVYDPTAVKWVDAWRKK